MKRPLVECIPNFSEGRRPEVIDAIVSAMQGAAAVYILDTSSDPDHNRTVITFAGTPEAVERAAFAAIKTAAELIDMTRHSGEHPRLGASDVVPFVPIRDVTMEECVELARRLGQRVGHELGIPVYLYEAAAASPDRQNLADLRSTKFQYEQLAEVIATDPARMPDFGPAEIGTAGATVIGARPPLVAFNVYLNTNNQSLAQKIARAVRHSSGGLRYVKGAGFMVEGQAQVSMNLTNYRQSPIARVVELVRREAQRYGVAIHHTELVGLTPEEALIDAAQWYLQLDGFEPDQILERRLFDSDTTAASEAAPAGPDFLDQLASATPAPGGGSAAAHTGAAGAALVAMVARLTIGKKKYESVKDQMWALIEQAETLRAELTAAVDEDAAAFEAVMAAFKLPKDTEEQQAARNAAV